MGVNLARVRAALGGALVIAALGAAGCGSDDDEATTGEDEDAGVVSNTVEVMITDDSLEPSNVDPETLLPGETITSTANVGDVTFELTNQASEAKSVVYNERGKEIPLAEDLAPGDSVTTTVNGTLGYHVYYDADEGPEGPKAQLHVID